MATEPGRATRKTAVRLRISLADHLPTIWRRLLVPGEIKLSKLHAILQAAMGWEDHHLHLFQIGDSSYGRLDDELDDEDIDEDSVLLSEVVRAPMRFSYQYDFGDDWQHEVVVESIEPVPLILKWAVCLDGQRAAHPRTAAGPVDSSSSSRRLAILTTPTTTSWSGGSDVPSTRRGSRSPGPTPPSSGCGNRPSGRALGSGSGKPATGHHIGPDPDQPMPGRGHPGHRHRSTTAIVVFGRSQAAHQHAPVLPARLPVHLEGDQPGLFHPGEEPSPIRTTTSGPWTA